MNEKTGRGQRSAGVVLALLTLIYVFNTMDRGIYAILAEPIRRELLLSDTQLGLLTGLAFALFYTVFGIPVAWLADRVGRVRVIVVACVIWSICSAAGGLASRFSHLALARMGVGIGEAGGAAPSYSLISTVYPPERRGTALGIFHLGASIGMLISATVSAWVAAHYGWRVALAVISLPGVLFAVILFLLVEEPANDVSGRPQRSLPVSIRLFLSDPVLRLTALAAGISSCTSFSINAWLPSYLMRVQGMSLSDMSQYYGAPFALFSGLGMWSAGFIADRLDRRVAGAYALVPACALLLTAPALVLATSMPDWASSFMAFWLPVMLAQMFLAPMLTIIQNHSAPELRGTASAIFLFVNSLVGAGLGPLYVGTISDLLKPAYGIESLRFGLMALAPIALSASAVQLMIVRRLRARRREQPAYPQTSSGAVEFETPMLQGTK
jgi:MFS family permease